MSTKKKKSGPPRSERRFVPQSAHSPMLVRALGGLGAMTLGAGAWGYTYGQAFQTDEALKAIPAYLIAGGSILTGVAIWLGTSSDAPLRVGDPGLGMERGEIRRMPWWGVSEIAWDAGALALAITGKDEAGASWSFKVPLASHAEAVGWIVSEARKRIPKRLEIPEEVVEKLPGASSYAGTKIELEPLQVVGKKCAVTGKIISYEPDAKICARCERVYVKRSVPRKCKCGASLVHLRSPEAGEGADEDAENETASAEDASG